jgi:hypothetical protein
MSLNGKYQQHVMTLDEEIVAHQMVVIFSPVKVVISTLEGRTYQQVGEARHRQDD